MREETYEFRKARKIYINYIQSQIGKLYIYLSWCYYKVPKYFNKDHFVRINASSEKVLTERTAQYIIGILNKIRMMPDVIGTSNCGKYIMFHYYYKKESGQIRFHIDPASSYIIFHKHNKFIVDGRTLIEPNTIKEVAWNIDDMTYLWDGVPPSDY